MTARSKPGTGQQLDNRARPVRVDAVITPGCGALTVVGYPPTVVVVPEPTVKGLQAQLRQMRAEMRAGGLGLTHPQFEAHWTAVFDRIEGWEKRGPSTSPEDNPNRAWAFKAFDKAELEGRLECPEKFRHVKRVIRDKTKAAPRQVDRWYEQWQRERGHN
jgi:hypothetical protein